MRPHPTGALELLDDQVSGLAYHVGIQVPDLDQARRFYCDLLGFQELFSIDASGPWLSAIVGLPDASVTSVQLAVPGGSRLELQCYEPQGTVGESRINNQGLNHLSFGVSDVAQAHHRLVEAGVTVRCDPTPIDAGPDHPLTGYSVFYFEDPWGLSLEILGPTARS